MRKLKISSAAIYYWDYKEKNIILLAGAFRKALMQDSFSKTTAPKHGRDLRANGNFESLNP